MNTPTPEGEHLKDLVTMAYRVLDEIVAWQRQETNGVVSEEIHVAERAQRWLRPHIRELDAADESERMERMLTEDPKAVD